jgi:hypothetical protein
MVFVVVLVIVYWKSNTGSSMSISNSKVADRTQWNKAFRQRSLE